MKTFTFYKGKDDSQTFSYEAETLDQARMAIAKMLNVSISQVHRKSDASIQPNQTQAAWRPEPDLDF